MDNRYTVIIFIAIVLVGFVLFFGTLNENSKVEHKLNKTENKTTVNKIKQIKNITNNNESSNNVVLVVDKYQNILPHPIKPITLDNLYESNYNITDIPKPINNITIPENI